MSKKYYILGAGGHAKVCYDLLSVLGYTLEAFISNDIKQVGEKFLGIEIISEEVLINYKSKKDILIVNGLGSTETPYVRAELYEKFISCGFFFPNLIHPSSTISSSAEIGNGTQIMAGSIIQASVDIMENVIINTGAIIDHDCRIQSHTHIAPGVVCSGGVSIGQKCHIGTGSKIIQGVHVSDEVLIACGSVVINHVDIRSRVAGVPAKNI